MAGARRREGQWKSSRRDCTVRQARGPSTHSARICAQSIHAHAGSYNARQITTGLMWEGVRRVYLRAVLQRSCAVSLPQLLDLNSAVQLLFESASPPAAAAGKPTTDNADHGGDNEDKKSERHPEAHVRSVTITQRIARVLYEAHGAPAPLMTKSHLSHHCIPALDLVLGYAVHCPGRNAPVRPGYCMSAQICALHARGRANCRPGRTDINQKAM